jgi:hypothetical protein
MDTHAAIAEPPRARVPTSVLRVGVLVDLPLGPQAGGHVRCWERLADVAHGYAGTLDLHDSLHRPGARAALTCRQCPLYSGAAGLRHGEPIVSLARAGSYRPCALAQTAGGAIAFLRCDPYDGRLFRLCADGDDRERAPRNSHRQLRPHQYARIRPHPYRADGGADARPLPRLDSPAEALRIAERVEARMLRQLADYQRRCAFALVSRPD